MGSDLPLPPLPYSYSALEPYIDTMTMQIHYSKHFAGWYCVREGFEQQSNHRFRCVLQHILQH